MVFENYEILGGVASRSRQAGWLAGKSAHHAAQLDCRSEGTLVDFKLDGHAGPAGSSISVFTTRVDTIFGATSVQLAPEHPLVADLTANKPELRAKVDQLISEQRRAREVGDIGEIEKHG